MNDAANDKDDDKRVALPHSSPLANLKDAKNSLTSAVATIGSGGGDMIMRLLKDGTWVYGADNQEIEVDSLWAIDPESLMHGYICWGDNVVLGEVMSSLFKPKPDASMLPQLGATWDEQLSWIMKCVNGEDEGVQVIYKPTSRGGMTAARGFLQALIKRVEEDPANLVAVVKLEAGSYQHKKWGKIYTPSLTIVDWTNSEALAAGNGGEEPPPAQSTVKRRVTKPEPVKAKAPAQPIRRRRPA